ncbi:MAG: CHAT domain-containing protein [Flavobacteriales bacterium]|nr:CHAT domain-containing protein [Flavobacteriales bacterium]
MKKTNKMFFLNPIKPVKKQAILLFLILASSVLSNAQTLERLKEAAEKGGYGIIFTQIEETGITEMCPAFKGLVNIDLTSNFDSVLNSHPLNLPECKDALMRIARNLVNKGVQYRKDQKLYEAYLCYRFAFPLVTKYLDAEGCRILSGNIFIVQNLLRSETSSPQKQWVNTTIQKDAKAILNRYSDAMVAFSEGESFQADKVFLCYTRLLNLSGNWVKGRRVMLDKLNKDETPNDYLMHGLLENLTQVSLEEILFQNEKIQFDSLMDAYRKLRPSLALFNNNSVLQELYKYVIAHFEYLRGITMRSTGILALESSYALNEYYNLFCRDLSFLMLNGNDLQGAIEMLEKAKSGVFTELMAKGHLNNRIKINQYDQQSYSYLQTVNGGEIYDLVTSDRSSFLMYSHYFDDLEVWFITSKGKVFHQSLEGSNHYINDLIDKTNFNNKMLSSKEGYIEGRGVKMPNVNSNNSLEPYSDLFKAIIPENIWEVLKADSANNLIIIPDENLHFVPFAALKTPEGKYLLEEKQISYWHSFTFGQLLKSSSQVFDVQKSIKNGTGSFKISVLGNPDFNGIYPSSVDGKVINLKLAPLPGTEKEIKYLGEKFHITPLMKMDVRSDLLFKDQALDILHLATHGYTNIDKVLQSFVAFSDGPVYASEMYESPGKLKSKMVVLSACQTGLGKVTNDNPVGLTQAFLVAGANSVISSLWSVSDDATFTLMKLFYDGISEGKNLAEALRFAQLELMKSQATSNPFYWSAFKVTGNVTNPRD